MWVALAAGGLTAACGAGGDATPAPTGPSTPVAPAPTAIAAVSGSGQSATAGSAIAAALAVRVTSSVGAPVPGVTVTFQVTSGFATLSSTVTSTDGNGEARVIVTTGTTPGAIIVTAAAQGVSAPATFSLTATAPPVQAVCTPSSTIAPGTAVVLATTTPCLPGGATIAAEYALIAFNGSTDPLSARTAVTLAGTNVTAVNTPLATASLVGAESDALAATIERLARLALRSNGTQSSIEPSRRRMEYRMAPAARTKLEALLPRARSWYAARRSSGIRYSMIPRVTTVGSLVTLNTTGEDLCETAEPRAGRVAAIGRKAIVIADTLNPGGGFSTADYELVAAAFDDIVDVVDTKNFGEPTDIDDNGHVVLFFTTAVNALTPRGSRGYVAGFFTPRDLYPTTDNAQFDGCRASNTGEMFYLLAPDPAGTVNGNVFSKEFARANALVTTAHEYQHLINASRRMYVNRTATSYEETWLDEGLAHTAEELLFYARAGLGPLANIDVPRLASNPTYSARFLDDAVGNFELLGLFLEDMASFSPYAEDVDLETRGAAWSLLRYIADQTTPTEQEQFWKRLVNSSRSGLANLREVVGDPTPFIRDWTTALLLDDVAGAASRYQFPSWHLRSVFGALTSTRSYPLLTAGLGSDATYTMRLAAGSAGVVRFTVPAGSAGAVSITLPSPRVQTTVVRLR